MNQIDRYIAKTLIGGFLMVAFFLLALSAFIAFIGQMDNLGGSYDLYAAFQFVIFSMPQKLYELFPLAVLIGALLGLGNLASGNELVVLRVSGVSMVRLTQSVLTGGIILAVACALLGEFVAPNSEAYARQLKTAAIYHRISLFGPQGIWARSRDDNLFINIRVMTSTDRLQGIYLYEIGKDGRLIKVINAASAELNDDSWQLLQLKETTLGENGTDTRRIRRMKWNTRLDASLLQLFVVEPDILSAKGLYDYVRYLERNDLNATQYITAFWARIVIPLSVLVMVVLALPFVFGPLRSVGAGLRIVVGMLIGVAFYLVNNTLMHSGAVFNLNPVMTAWSPTLLLAIIAGYAVKRVG